MATIAECAAHLDMGERNLIELISRGVIERQPGRGKYDLDAVRTAYIRHLRSVAAGRKPEGGDEAAPSTLDKERERYMRTRADREELRLERDRGALIPADQVADAWSAAVTTMKQRLLAIPNGIAPEAAALRSATEIEKLCRDAITETLEELVATEVDGATSQTEYEGAEAA